MSILNPFTVRRIKYAWSFAVITIKENAIFKLFMCYEQITKEELLLLCASFSLPFLGDKEKLFEKATQWDESLGIFYMTYRIYSK